MKSPNSRCTHYGLIANTNSVIRSSILSNAAGVALSLITPSVVRALDESQPDSVGVDEKGLFALCPNSQALSSCVSSQDDRPAVFLPPWCYDGSYILAKERLIAQILTVRGATIKALPTMANNDRFFSVEFINPDNAGIIDDAEFYFTPNDNTIQFRSIRRGNSIDFGTNRQRLENLRIALRLESVPVLRFRRLSLFFGESPLDSFGPPTNDFDDIADFISGDVTDSKSYDGNRESETLHSSSSRNEKINTKGVIGELNPIRAPVWTSRNRVKYRRFAG